MGVSDKIDEFLSTLAELKKSLDSDISLSTSIVSSRTSEMVEELGWFSPLTSLFVDCPSLNNFFSFKAKAETKFHGRLR